MFRAAVTLHTAAAACTGTPRRLSARASAHPASAASTTSSSSSCGHLAPSSLSLVQSPASRGSRARSRRVGCRMSAAAPTGTDGPRAGKQSSAAATTMLPGVGVLASTKSVWLLDQFGVLHDGQTAYPAAIEATRRLHEAGCRLFIISNSSRRSGNTLKKLEPMGFNPEWFSAWTPFQCIHIHVISSTRYSLHSLFGLLVHSRDLPRPGCPLLPVLRRRDTFRYKRET